MSDSKVVSNTGRPKPPNAGKGRKKGVPNKITTAMKEMALEALAELGGKAYLVQVGKLHPAIFMTYLGRFAPSELRVGNPDGSPFTPDTAKRMVGLQGDDNDPEATPRAPIGFHTGGE